MADIRIPSNANFDRINEILVGWYRAKANESPARLDDAANRVGVDVTVISRQNAFLQDVGFLRKEAAGFLLSELGAQYAKFIDFGQVEEAKGTLREILREWGSIQPLLDYIDLNSPVSKKDLRGRIALAADRKDAGGSVPGISAIISMLQFAEILTEGDEGFRVKLDILRALEGQEMASPVRERGAPGVPEREARIAATFPTRLPMPMQVEISLTITEDSDPDKLKKVLRAIRDALSEEEEE